CDPFAVRRELTIELIKSRPLKGYGYSTVFKRQYPKIASSLRNNLRVQQITPVATPVHEVLVLGGGGEAFRKTGTIGTAAAKLLAARECHLPSVGRPDGKGFHCRIEGHPRHRTALESIHPDICVAGIHA